MTAPISTAHAVLRLARANMTVISAVTYLAAAVLATRGDVDARAYFAGWLFVILTQFMTHFLGEVADARSDTLNRYSTPITGGSGVLPADDASVTMANFMGYLCALLAATVLRYLVPPPAFNVGVTIQILAWAYSAEPVKLNHRCLGEVDAAIVTNALLPYFAAAVQGVVNGQFPWYDRSLAILVVPPFLVKISLFLVLNLADRRADWATGKVTLAVWLGDRVCARLHFALMLLAYISAAVIAYFDNTPLMLLFILPSLPYGARITRALVAHVPYSLAPLLGPALLHSTLLVWGVLLHTLATSPYAGFRFYHAIAGVFLYISVEKVIKGRRRAAAERAKQAQLAQDPIHLAALRTPKPSVLSDITDSSGAEDAADVPVLGDVAYTDIVVVGAGIEGLVCGLAAARQGLDVLILDSNRTADFARRLGKSIQLTPDQLELLATLGVSRTYLRRLPSDGHTTTASRDELASHLRPLARGLLVPATRVTHLVEDEAAECVRVHHGVKRDAFVVARVALGCDGARGAITKHVAQVLRRERGRSARWNTPRAISLVGTPLDACADAPRMLRGFWKHADGHLEAYYRFELAYRR